MSRTAAQIKEGSDLLQLSLKRCGGCDGILHLSAFYKGSGLGGHRPHCKSCMAAKSNAWRRENIGRVRELSRYENLSPERRESRRASSKRYYDRNQEKCAAKAREWREANPERVAEMKAAYFSVEGNRQKAREYSAAWRRANPEKHAAQILRRDREKQRASHRRWLAANPEKVRAYSRKAISTPIGKLRNRTRVRVRECLRNGVGGGRTFEILGYTLEELRAHLERQFLKGMSWENMDRWHIDHIIPLSSFTYTSIDDPEFKRAWGLANLRPLWARENMSKSDKIETLL